MYRILLDGHTIYNSASNDSNYKVISATLSLSENAAGSLDITFPPGHPAINLINMYASVVHVYRDDTWIWAGRAIDGMNMDIFGQLTVSFEGVLGFLNDTIQPSKVYGELSLSEFFYHVIPDGEDEGLLYYHNKYVDDSKKIYLGNITVDDGVMERYTEWESTFEAIEDIIKDTRGHLQIRYEDGKYYLDYLKDYNSANEQYIKFGENLLDYTTEYSMKNFATVILPLGKEDDIGNRLTLESYVNPDPTAKTEAGNPHVWNEEEVSKWGWIVKKYDSTEIDSQSVLYSYAKGLLTKSVNYKDLSFEINAIDLGNLDNNISYIKLLDQVRVISYPHDVDTYLPVTELELDLCDPSSDSFTLTGTESGSDASTSGSRSSSGSLTFSMQEDYISVLEKAQKDAADYIREATTGHVTIRPNAIYISELENYTLPNQGVWMWNERGLAYYGQGIDGEATSVAINNQGELVANAITTGTMSANRIRTGIIQSENNNTSWNLNTGIFTMKSGSIQLGTSSQYTLIDNTGMITSRNSDYYTTIYDGVLRTGFYNGTTKVETGVINGRANIYDSQADKRWRGMEIVAPYSSDAGSMIRITTDEMSLNKGHDPSATSTRTVTGTLHLYYEGVNYSIPVIHGMLCALN